MSKEKKYRIGNQPEEYELKTDYLGWLPKDTVGWFEFLHPSSDINFKANGKDVTIVSPDKKEMILVIDYVITKDAFPMSFYGEERSNNWRVFCIVSTKNNREEKFIIPSY